MNKFTRICLALVLLAAIIAISTLILNPDLLGADNLRNFFNTSDINLAINIAAISAVGLIVIAFLILIANETKLRLYGTKENSKRQKNIQKYKSTPKASNIREITVEEENGDLTTNIREITLIEKNGYLTTLEFLVEEHNKFGFKYTNIDSDDYIFRYFYHTSDKIETVNSKYISGAINISYSTKKIADKIYRGSDLQNIYYDIDGKGYRLINGKMQLPPSKNNKPEEEIQQPQPKP